MVMGDDDYRKRRGKKLPFDIFTLCKPRQMMHIPEVLIELNKNGVDFNYAREQLANQLQINRMRISTMRTSEIFITGNTRGGRVEKRRLSFYLKLGDYHISHFTIS